MKMLQVSESSSVFQLGTLRMIFNKLVSLYIVKGKKFSSALALKRSLADGRPNSIVSFLTFCLSLKALSDLCLRNQ